MSSTFVKQATRFAAVVLLGVAGSASAAELNGRSLLSADQLDMITAGAAAAVIATGDAIGAGATNSTVDINADLNATSNGSTATAQGTVVSKATGTGAGAGALTEALVIPIGNRSRAVTRTKTVGNATNAFSQSVAAGVAVSVDPFVRPARP